MRVSSPITRTALSWVSSASWKASSSSDSPDRTVEDMEHAQTGKATIAPESVEGKAPEDLVCDILEQDGFGLDRQDSVNRGA